MREFRWDNKGIDSTEKRAASLSVYSQRWIRASLAPFPAGAGGALGQQDTMSPAGQRWCGAHAFVTCVGAAGGRLQGPACPSAPWSMDLIWIICEPLDSGQSAVRAPW